MKISILTDANGEIIGTGWVFNKGSEQTPFGYGEILADEDEGQKLQEIDVPAELIEIESAEELHKRLREFLPK